MYNFKVLYYMLSNLIYKLNIDYLMLDYNYFHSLNIFLLSHMINNIVDMAYILWSLFEKCLISN